MRMASWTAAKPSLAFLMVSRLIFFSSPRSSVAVSKFVWRLVISPVNRSISDSSSSCFSWRPLISMSSFCVSAKRKSRSSCAFDTSLSQKPFFVASDVDSARRRSISFWISFLTSPKGSSDKCIASVDSAMLPRRCPSCPRKATTFSCLAFAASEAACAPRSFDTRPSFPRPSDTSCTNDGAAPGWCLATVASLAACAAFAMPAWSRARLLTSVSNPETLDWRTSSASVRAAISSARVWDRWSQSFALSSHIWVRSFRYNWSSLSNASALTRSPRAVAMSTRSVSMSPSRRSIASPLSRIFSSKLLIVSSKLVFAFPHSVSSSSFSARKSFKRPVSVSMMP
mmetsp:Transcript_73279/g.143764  ORF Transcript_73279/g.143764 Transcript_73279/m.143764 type:complete len:341 (-) Transcript_73279:47-1069(-)